MARHPDGSCNRETPAAAGRSSHQPAELSLRLRGGSASGKIAIVMRPRVQKDKWSLYWKESMETKTDCLEDVAMEVDLDSTFAQLHQELGKKLSWQPVEGLQRLEGFTDPWERSMLKGREIVPANTLRTAQVTPGDVIITVRRELIAEAWRIVGEDEDDSSSGDDDEW